MLDTNYELRYSEYTNSITLMNVCVEQEIFSCTPHTAGVGSENLKCLSRNAMISDNLGFRDVSTSSANDAWCAGKILLL